MNLNRTLIPPADAHRGITLGCVNGPYIGGTTAYQQNNIYIGNKLIKREFEGRVEFKKERNVRLKI